MTTPPPEESTEDSPILEPKPLKWVEIPFTSVQEELDTIDEYERQENLADDDPWPKFLRGAAYEYWGLPELALAQYAKTINAGGLRRIPQLWERRAYNAFKLGQVGAAHAYHEMALVLLYESCGNPLHIAHWFNENFKGYVPKWNGPAAPVQRGICNYCMRKFDGARESFIAQIAARGNDLEHAILWFLASSAQKSSADTLSNADERVLSGVVNQGFEWDDRLQLFLNLFFAAARGLEDEVTAAESALSSAISSDEKDDITSNLYMALYHDAFTKDTTERDRALDVIAAIGAPPSTRDTENFLFYTARHRFRVPEGGGNEDIPEKVPM